VEPFLVTGFEGQGQLQPAHDAARRYCKCGLGSSDGGPETTGEP